jgi:nitroreductase
MDYESLLELFKGRRSIRRFKPDSIPDEYVGKIIEAARWAPSGFNTQPWEFMVVRKREIRERIVELVDKYASHCPGIEDIREPWLRDKLAPQPYEMSWTNAPVFIILFGDTRTKGGLPMRARVEYYREQWLFVSSLANAFLHMHLAATTLGLASQWVSAVKDPWVNSMLRELFKAPREWEAFDMMPVGYPDEKPRPKFMRDPEGMVHHDVCKEEDIRPDEDIHDFVRKTRTWVISRARKAGK